MSALRQSGELSGEGDESFYAALRESALAAGATDIDAIATDVVSAVVECTADDPEERRLQFELIVLHLSCTDMTVRIRPDDSVRRLSFRPARKRTDDRVTVRVKVPPGRCSLCSKADQAHTLDLAVRLSAH